MGSPASTPTLQHAEVALLSLQLVSAIIARVNSESSTKELSRIVPCIVEKFVLLLQDEQNSAVLHAADFSDLLTNLLHELVKRSEHTTSLQYDSLRQG